MLVCLIRVEQGGLVRSGREERHRRAVEECPHAPWRVNLADKDVCFMWRSCRRGGLDERKHLAQVIAGPVEGWVGQQPQPGNAEQGRDAPRASMVRPDCGPETEWFTEKCVVVMRSILVFPPFRRKRRAGLATI